MSSKYNRHPMEVKARMDMEKNRAEEAEKEKVFRLALEGGGFRDSIETRRAFRQGWTDGKFFLTNSTEAGSAPAAPAGDLEAACNRMVEAAQWLEQNRDPQGAPSSAKHMGVLALRLRESAKALVALGAQGQGVPAPAAPGRKEWVLMVENRTDHVSAGWTPERYDGFTVSGCRIVRVIEAPTQGKGGDHP